MKKINYILIVALLAGASFAKENTTSVENILKDLGSQDGEAEEIALDAGVEPASSPAPVDVEELVADSRDYYVGGEFARAQVGFEKAVQLDPECLIARMYLRKIIERDHRLVEISGMKAVSEGWNTDLTLRSYALSADAVEKMGLFDAVASVDVEAKFPEVAFKKGASAVYQPSMEKLFIRNTRENLLIIEEILEAMDVAKLSADVEQVEIEAKFVEVSEGTLEELGFEWSTGAGGIDTGLQGNDITIPGQQGLFNNSLRGGAGVGMPFGDPVLNASIKQNSDSSDWAASRFEDTFSVAPETMRFVRGGNAVPFETVISALDQSSGADVLSAPRIVVKSGEDATIRVGQLHTYPAVYSVGGTDGNIIHVKYEDWEERLLGVELAVTPQVDGDQIELGLSPKFRELQGWQNYGVADANSAYTYRQSNMGFMFEHAAINARLPIFRVREIETEVTIADGSTMVMGGLINEKVEAFEDKVPLLGSLPLVGRLFRNEGERAIKRNLMMFVTAKIVEPTGRINTSRSFE